MIGIFYDEIYNVLHNLFYKIKNIIYHEINYIFLIIFEEHFYIKITTI